MNGETMLKDVIKVAAIIGATAPNASPEEKVKRVGFSSAALVDQRCNN
jgi:hypothetical protein